MKRHRLVAAIGAILIMCTVQMTAQSSRVEGGIQSQADFDFYWETRLLPPMPPLGNTLGMVTLTSGTDTIHRVMLDRLTKVYFGYDARVTVQRTASGTQYTVAFGPLSYPPELIRTIGADARTWKLLPAPKFPAPRTIRSGEVLELTLLTNDTWGQRMVENVTVQPPDPARYRLERGPNEFAFPSGAPRDFTVADVALRLSNPTAVFLVQETVGGSRSSRMVTLTGQGEESGTIVWIYLPGRGRFLLSLVPRGKFLRAGVVTGSNLEFTVNGSQYHVYSSSVLAPIHARFNLYVLHQPGWKPTYDHANLDVIQIGSADRLDYLLGKE